MNLLDLVKKTMCCPSGICSSPGDCFWLDKSRMQLVDIETAAPAVVAVVLEWTKDSWRKQAGPYSRETTLEAAGGLPSGDLVSCETNGMADGQ